MKYQCSGQIKSGKAPLMYSEATPFTIFPSWVNPPLASKNKLLNNKVFKQGESVKANLTESRKEFAETIVGKMLFIVVYEEFTMESSLRVMENVIQRQSLSFRAYCNLFEFWQSKKIIYFNKICTRQKASSY